MKMNTRLKSIILMLIPWLIFAATIYFSFLLMDSDKIKTATADVFFNILRFVRIIALIVGIISVRTVLTDAIGTLRREIIKALKVDPVKSYQLASLFYEDVVACFPNEEVRWDGALFMLDLIAKKIYVNLSTYPNPISREENRDLTPQVFHQIAEQFHFRQELRALKTEKDLTALFNSSLNDAVSSAQRKLSLQKAKEMKKNAIPISARFYKSPALNITEFTLIFFQKYAESRITMKRENDHYHLLYRSSNTYGNSIDNCGHILSDPEAAWVEDQIDIARNNTDTDTWQSLVGGDRMCVEIKTGDTVCEEYSGCPLKKYMDIMDNIQILAKYGSSVKAPRVKAKFDVKKAGQSLGIEHRGVEKYIFNKYSNQTIELLFQVGWNEGSHSGGAGGTVIIPAEWFKLTWDEFLDRFCERYYDDYNYSKAELDTMSELKKFLGF